MGLLVLMFSPRRLQTILESLSSKTGWYKKARLWRFVFLQHEEVRAHGVGADSLHSNASFSVYGSTTDLTRQRAPCTPAKGYWDDSRGLAVALLARSPASGDALRRLKEGDDLAAARASRTSKAREKLNNLALGARALLAGKKARRAVRKAKALALVALSAAGEDDEAGISSGDDSAGAYDSDDETLGCAISGPFPDTAIEECMPECLRELGRKADTRFRSAAAAAMAVAAAIRGRRAAMAPDDDDAGTIASEAPYSPPPPDGSGGHSPLALSPLTDAPTSPFAAGPVTESVLHSNPLALPEAPPAAAAPDGATASAAAADEDLLKRLPLDIGSVWATCLAISALESMNSCWLAGEDEDVDITSVDKATLWLAKQARQHEGLDAILDDVMKSARERVVEWRAMQAAAVSHARRVNASHNNDRLRYDYEHLQGWLALSVRRNHGAPPGVPPC